MTDIARAYRSIFLEPNWAHQVYFGWQEREYAPGFRVLEKTRSGAIRLLVMIEPDFSRDLLLSALKAPLRTAEIVVHDFGAETTEPFASCGRHFTPLDADCRLLNIATYVVDLSVSEDEALARMSGDYRRKIRKAATSGLAVQAMEKPASGVIDRFEAAFATLAKERALSPIDRAAFVRMYENDDAILYVLRQGDEEVGYLHVYRAGGAAIFMTGVNPAKGNDGAGQFLHWEIMKDLKRRGVAWYDLGGVRSFDDSDGISRFKKSFGGVPVRLGGEWRCRAGWVGGALAARRLLLGKS